MPAPPLPIICDNCGGVSVANNIINVSHGGIIQAVGEGNSTVVCPYCGKNARLTLQSATSVGERVFVTLRDITPDQLNAFVTLIRKDVERLRIENPAAFDSVAHLADRANRGEIAEEEAAAKIAEFLPETSATAVKQYGARNTLNAVIVAVTLISGIATIGTGVKDMAAWLSPPALVTPPVPAPVNIHNHITVVNRSAAGVARSLSKPPIVKREQLRRAKQLEAQRKKRAEQERKPQPKGKSSSE